MTVRPTIISIEEGRQYTDNNQGGGGHGSEGTTERPTVPPTIQLTIISIKEGTTVRPTIIIIEEGTTVRPTIISITRRYDRQ